MEQRHGHWALKAENMHSLERAEGMMVRWMCGLSLKDIKQGETLYSLLGVQSMAKVVRHGRLRWFGHVEYKSEYWVSVCVGKGRKTGSKCVKNDTNGWRGLISGKTANPSWA